MPCVCVCLRIRFVWIYCTCFSVIPAFSTINLKGNMPSTCSYLLLISGRFGKQSGWADFCGRTPLFLTLNVTWLHHCKCSKRFCRQFSWFSYLSVNNIADNCLFLICKHCFKKMSHLITSFFPTGIHWIQRTQIQNLAVSLNHRSLSHKYNKVLTKVV